MDETRIQCNKEEGKLPGSESFMWVMRSAASEEIQAAFFFYSRSRSGENARKLLKSFDGYLITDAYSGYDTEYSCAMKSHFRKFGNQMSGSGNHLCNYASLLA